MCTHHAVLKMILDASVFGLDLRTHERIRTAITGGLGAVLRSKHTVTKLEHKSVHTLKGVEMRY